MAATKEATLKSRTKQSKEKKKPGATRKKKPTKAERADRHICYERAVQCPEAEIDFVDATFLALTGRRAALLREDFCGTGNTTCEWVRRRATNRGIGVDIDGPTLDWGRQNHVAKLKPAERERVSLVEADVLTVATDAPDIVLAMNFSYWIFTERAKMREYFERVRDSLGDDGVFFLDCYGGYDAFRELKERTDHGDFTYVWDQEYYNPVTGAYKCNIHFEFPDGSKIKRAFSYEWRLWTLPEVREILAEAGFSRVTVYWQGWDDDEDEGDGVFVPVTEADADAGWICYITARR